MEVRRSRNGKAVLVIGGNNIIRVIAIKGNGPVFEFIPLVEFRKEYVAVISMPLQDALLSFIAVSKRAYRYDMLVLQFLWSELMKTLAESSLKELVAVYNNLAKQLSMPERKNFDSKAVAISAITALDEKVQVATPAQEVTESKSTKSRSTKMTQDADGNEVAVEAKPRGKGIGARANELILEGKTTQEVIDTIKAEIEGANPTPATIAWYKNKLRKDGKLAMPVKKEKVVKAKKVKKVEADVDASEDEGEFVEEAVLEVHW
jgi:hypothetical protein